MRRSPRQDLWGVVPGEWPVGAAQGPAGELVVRGEHTWTFPGEDFTFVSQTWGNIQSVGQKGHLMGSVIVRRPTCKAPNVFRADYVDPVDFSFQPEPASPTPTREPPLVQGHLLLLMATLPHPASPPQSTPPPGQRAGQASPQGLVGLHSKGQGPLLGSTGLPHAPGTQGHRCAKKRLETQQCRPSSRSPIPPGITPVPRFLLCSILSLSLPPLLSVENNHL